MSVTGIPIEYLFAIVGAMVAGIYLDLRREVRSLRKESIARGTQIALIKQMLNAVCKHIKLPYSVFDEDDTRT